MRIRIPVIYNPKCLATVFAATFYLLLSFLASGAPPANSQQDEGVAQPYSLKNAVPVPKAICGPGSMPELGLQGQIPAADYKNGRASKGYTCNTQMAGTYNVPGSDGGLGGFNVWYYKDKAGNACAFYDTSSLIPINIYGGNAGVNVLDMADSSHPVLSTTLQTPAMLSPHESLILNPQRGLLMAVLGNPASYPGLVDIYDVSENCRAPVLKASRLAGLLGHESGLSPDGKTFYTNSPLVPTTMGAVDVSNSESPRLLTAYPLAAHGMSFSEDGNTAYVAVVSIGGAAGTVAPLNSLVILDVSEVQRRKPLPVIREISRLSWKGAGAPQYAAPFTSKGRSFLLEVDEFGSAAGDGGLSGVLFGNASAARIIDISNPKKPKIISDVRLEVHQASEASVYRGDPGAGDMPGYAAHYCNVQRRTDPKIAACSMGLSGLRVFNIENPYRPREAAYFIPPNTTRDTGGTTESISKPTFVSERSEIWYNDNHGFYAVKITNGAWPAD